MFKLVGEVCESLAEELGFELVDIEYVKEFGSYFLRVFIDKPGGVTSDDCEEMSVRLSPILDEKDPIKEPYYLEVSSPGLDRPLKTDKDLKRNLNKEVEIKLYKALNKVKNYQGRLVEFNDDTIIIEDGSGEVISLPRDLISLVRLVIKF
ncbi:MAG: ribosome maturation factor RimP [Tissierellia bacterium]|nr:ribosome maturation factor RimP [Tissierellia bacterium]